MHVYDTSLLNIIERLSGTEAALRPGDFAYLKDVGVYPNNRLMIARRFLSPHGDNIYGKAGNKVSSIPSAILISWKPQDEEFIEISFGEEWIPANADFTNVMNDLGKDFGMSGKLSLGDMGNAGFNIVSLPGFTEVIQRKVLQRMGIIDADGLEKAQGAPLPSGNPNLIKEAKRRKTIDYGKAESGLKCTVNVKMICEWEQKFISGIDPTIVFQDLLANVLRFATSNSDTYGLAKSFEEKIKGWIDKPETIAKDMVAYVTEALENLTSKLTSLVNGFYDSVIDQNKTEAEINAEKAAEKKAEIAAVTEKKAGVDNFVKNAINELKDTLNKVIQKYRLEIEGIARALSGAPSTPWHITIGNPLRPTFCAGDMYMADNMTLKLGSTLAFNDLPSNIIAEFTLTNARPWGLQEILAKFNAGSLRVSNGLKDTNSLSPGQSLDNGITNDGEAYNDSATGTASNTGTTSIVGNSSQSPASKVTNAASQKPTIDNVSVVSVGTQTEEQKKLAISTKDAPTILNGFNGGNTGLPLNTSTTLSQVSNSSQSQVTGAMSSVQTAISTTKESSSVGEQIVKDASSQTAVTYQNIA